MTYDVIVIGSGPGGYSAAVRAGQYGLKAAIHCDNPKLDWPLVSDRKNKIVSKHAKGVEFLLKKSKVEACSSS